MSTTLSVYLSHILIVSVWTLHFLKHFIKNVRRYELLFSFSVLFLFTADDRKTKGLCLNNREAGQPCIVPHSKLLHWSLNFKTLRLNLDSIICEMIIGILLQNLAHVLIQFDRSSIKMPRTILNRIRSFLCLDGTSVGPSFIYIPGSFQPMVAFNVWHQADYIRRQFWGVYF